MVVLMCLNYQNTWNVEEMDFVLEPQAFKNQGCGCLEGSVQGELIYEAVKWAKSRTTKE